MPCLLTRASLARRAWITVYMPPDNDYTRCRGMRRAFEFTAV